MTGKRKNKSLEEGVQAAIKEYHIAERLKLVADVLYFQEGNSDKIASTFIYASLGEYTAVNILEWVEINISILGNDLIAEADYGINRKREKEENKQTNLESTISKLRNYHFPNDTKIFGALVRLKKNRNRFFHNLVGVQSDAKEMYKLGEAIKADCERIIELFQSMGKLKARDKKIRTSIVKFRDKNDS